MKAPNQLITCLVASIIASIGIWMACVGSLIGSVGMAAFGAVLYRGCIVLVLYITFINTYEGE